MEQEAMLPLDQPRVIALKDGKFTYTFTFRRILHADWNKHFEAIRFTTREEGGGRVRVIDMDSAGVELVQSTIQQADGYVDGFMSRTDWQKKILPRHATSLGWLLRHVSKSQEEGDSPIDPDRVFVRLDALWSQVRPGEHTIAYKGLVHLFSAPSSEQQKKMFRASAASTIVGGAKNPTTIYGTKHRVLLELYDELVLGVSGYSVAGTPLADDQSAIRREMDAYHKVQAVQQLFIGGGDSTAEDLDQAA